MVLRLTSLLQVRANEVRPAAFLAALFVLLQAGQGIGGNAADGLFFVVYGVDKLPYMFMALGALTFVITLLFTAGLTRLNPRSYLVALLAAFAAILLVERAALLLKLAALYPVLWLTINIINALLGTLLWYIAGEVCDTRQAKRLFSLFASAGILGGVVGNLVTGALAAALGTENLILLFTALIVAGLFVTRETVRRFFRPPVRRRAKASIWADLGAGYEYVRSHRLLRLTAFASVLFSILFFSISFPFSQEVTHTFANNPAGVAGFLGLFSALATAVTFVVSLLLASRVYTRLGVVNAILLLPLVYVAGFALWAVNFSLVTAALARLAQMVVLAGIAGTAWSALFYVVPPERRGQALGFDAGVPSQIGVVLSGVLLILGDRVLSTTQIFEMGMVVALACGYLVWRMRPAYGEALIHALRAGLYEVFGGGPHPFASFQGNANALRVALGALDDPKPSTRRLAAEILAQMGTAGAAPGLVRRLDDPDAEVRRAAVSALGRLGARDAAGAVAARLNDPDAGVQASALEVLPQLSPPATPELVAQLENLAGTAEPPVRANAVLALSHFDGQDRARPALNALLCDPQPETRVLGLNTLAKIAGARDARTRPELAPAVAALRDPATNVRLAACAALGEMHDEAGIEPLVGALSDPDPAVRQAAAQGLKLSGARATPRVLQVLEGAPDDAQAAALEALTPNDPALLAPLHEYARREIAQARTAREMAAALPNAGRATRLLSEWLRQRADESEQHLVKTVGLLGHREAMELVAKGLEKRDAETRAAAVETLETLGNKQLAREIIPLLDDAPEAGPRAALTPADALAQLLARREGWTRALAARAAAETEQRALSPNLRVLAGDPEPVARQAAREALAHFGEVLPMETLQTVSPLERILLLREVPLFATLSPEDLKQLAEVAREHLYPDGALIVREGDEGDEMYVIAAGQVRVTKLINGIEKHLATRGVGEFIGEMAIIESATRFATVRAEGEVRALVLDANAFKSILRDRPEVSLAVLRGLSRRLREKV